MATQFSGGVYVNTTFTGAARSDFQANLKTQLLSAGWTNVAQETGQGPGNVGTVTITIASPAVVTFNSHGFLGGEKIIFQTTGALPTGLVAGTVYYVKYIDANTFNVAATLGGANINTTGSQSGTHTLNAQSILLQSATQPTVTNPIRVRIKDNGTYADFSIENQARTLIGTNDGSSGGHLTTGIAKTYRVIATKYHFLCFTPGVSGAREFVMAGMLYVPSFLAGITDHGYMISNGWGSSASLASSFRIGASFLVGGAYAGGNPPNSQLLWQSNICENSNRFNTSGVGDLTIIITSSGDGFQLGRACGYRWANDDINTSDILLAAGLATVADEAKIKGQFFDMIYIAEAFSIDNTDTFNGHTWFNLTNNQIGSAGGLQRGGIWVATS